MKIRLGTYTLNENIEMTITEYYGHGLDQELEKNHRILSYSKEYGQLDGFTLDEVSDSYKKDILITDLKNAFFVTTKILYKKEELFVWAFKDNNKTLTVYTKNETTGKKNNFIQLSDRYVQEIKIGEVEKIWEERKPSEYKIPMPKGIELIKEIDISQDSL